ncbi:MAG: AAA family ATPase [Spirulinaceae cyanobacterium]
MKPMVLGFAGQIASGKSTLSKEIAKYLGWQRVSFGDYVRTIAQYQGLDESREVLQTIGASLMNQGKTQFCESVLAEANWKPEHPLVIDGIRHSEIVSILRQIVSPLDFSLIFVFVNESVRCNRLVERGFSNYQHQQKIEADSTEVQVQNILSKIADLTLDGTHNSKDLVQEIVIWMQKSD